MIDLHLLVFEILYVMWICSDANKRNHGHNQSLVVFKLASLFGGKEIKLPLQKSMASDQYWLRQANSSATHSLWLISILRSEGPHMRQ